jgi:hypothetical protein
VADREKSQTIERREKKRIVREREMTSKQARGKRLVERRNLILSSLLV